MNKKKKPVKRLLNPIIYRVAGLFSAICLRRWMSSLDFKAALYDPDVDPASPNCQGQKLYIFWHEYIPLPVYLRSHCNISILLSQHRDAEMLAHAVSLLGFDYGARIRVRAVERPQFVPFYRRAVTRTWR